MGKQGNTYKSNLNYLLQKIQDRYALIGLADKAAQMRNMILLNETAAFMIRKFDDGEAHSANQIVGEVLAAYEVSDKANVLSDFEKVAENMVQNNYWIRL